MSPDRSTDIPCKDAGVYVAAALMVGVLIGGLISLSFLQGAIAGAAWSGIVGAGIGGLIAYFSTIFFDRTRRLRECEEIEVTVYAEIADRSARCLNDYISPLRERRVSAAAPLQAQELRMFRPLDPVVWKGTSGKMGLLEPRAVLAITQFYYRLEAVSQGFDALVKMCEQRYRPGTMPTTEQGDQEQIDLIIERLRSCMRPAAEALNLLNVPRHVEFDTAACRVYPHLAATGDELRVALLKHAI